MKKIKVGSNIEVDGRVGVVERVVRKKSKLDKNGRRRYLITVKGEDWKRDVVVGVDTRKYEVTTN